MTMEDNEYINSVTKRLYPEIAKRNNTTASRAVSYTHLSREISWLCFPEVLCSFTAAAGGKGPVGPLSQLPDVSRSEMPRTILRGKGGVCERGPGK